MIRCANLTGSISRNAGGLFESVRRLVQTMWDTGMELCVFGSEDEHTSADYGAWAPVPVKAFRSLGPRQFGYSPRFREALFEFSPDLVHTHGLWHFSSVATNQYCRSLDIPYVISAHGMLDLWAVRHSRWKKAIAHFFYESAHLRGAGCLRALCEAEAHAIRQLGLKNPIAIIPNGIDLPEATRLKPEDRSQRMEDWKWKMGDGRKILLYLGRIHPKKGLVNLLRAWAVANRQSTEWVLAIAGWDQDGHEAELKRLATELGVKWMDVHSQVKVGNRTSDNPAFKSQLPTSKLPSLIFLGPRFGEDKAACYQNCDAFILPSFSEGLPMVVLEAWAHSKTVLMTPECNLPEGFTANAALRIELSEEAKEQGGKAGRATPCARSPGHSLESGLQDLFAMSNTQRLVLGANGLALVRAKFAWPVIGQEMAQLYEWMLGGGSKPACIRDF